MKETKRLQGGCRVSGVNRLSDRMLAIQLGSENGERASEEDRDIGGDSAARMGASLHSPVEYDTEDPLQWKNMVNRAGRRLIALRMVTNYGNHSAGI